MQIWLHMDSEFWWRNVAHRGVFQSLVEKQFPDPDKMKDKRGEFCVTDN